MLSAETCLIPDGVFSLCPVGLNDNGHVGHVGVPNKISRRRIGCDFRKKKENLGTNIL